MADQLTAADAINRLIASDPTVQALESKLGEVNKKRLELQAAAQQPQDITAREAFGQILGSLGGLAGGALAGGKAGRRAGAAAAASSLSRGLELLRQKKQQQQGTLLAQSELLGEIGDQTRDELERREKNLFTLGRDEAKNKAAMDRIDRRAEKGVGSTNVTIEGLGGDKSLNRELFKTVSGGKKVIKEVDSILKDLAGLEKKGRLEFQLNKLTTETPEGQLKARIDRLAALALKGDQGARPSDFDVQFYRKLLNGDILATPPTIRKLLNNFRASVVRGVESDLDLADSISGAPRGGTAFKQLRSSFNDTKNEADANLTDEEAFDKIQGLLP